VERRRGSQEDAGKIKFGTDGWRAVIADGFTFDNVARVAEATAKFILSADRKKLDIYTDWGSPYRPAADGVVVGYDMRFLSPEFAHYFARVLHDSGIPVTISDAPVTTPAVSYAVVQRNAAAGIMFTASHNPPIYNGIKYKAEYGGSAPSEVTDEVEKHLTNAVPTPRCPEGAIERIDMKTPFLEKVRTLIDPARLTASPVHVVIDSMYGSAQGYVSQLLHEYGVSYTQIRGRHDPLFGGKKPEPLEENLVPLRAVIAALHKRKKGNMIGVVTDGDGDRISAMDEKGGFIDAHRTFALIFRYLVEQRGLRGSVITAFNLTDMVHDMCEDYGLTQIVVPIGFKHHCEQILKRGDVLIAGEESGSIAIQGHIPERDGVLHSVLLSEIVASANKPASELVQSLFDKYGPCFYHRRDIEVEGRLEVVAKLKENPPETFAGRRVTKVETLDGVKLRFKDGWLLFRASGTEPILRLYSEMRTMKDVHELLAEAERLARGELRLW
jgi:phosphomannomutase